MDKSRGVYLASAMKHFSTSGDNGFNDGLIKFLSDCHSLKVDSMECMVNDGVSYVDRVALKFPDLRESAEVLKTALRRLLEAGVSYACDERIKRGGGDIDFVVSKIDAVRDAGDAFAAVAAGLSEKRKRSPGHFTPIRVKFFEVIRSRLIDDFGKRYWENGQLEITATIMKMFKNFRMNWERRSDKKSMTMKKIVREGFKAYDLDVGDTVDCDYLISRVRVICQRLYEWRRLKGET